VSATFTLNTYTVTATAGSGGTVVCTPPTVNHGGTSTCTITPDTGHHIVDVVVDGGSVGPVPSYAFNNVIANRSISASFAINTYTITATAGDNGSISPTGAVVVNYGTNTSFTITPAMGFQVTDVLVDGVSVGAVTNYEFASVTANHTISANFDLIITGAMGATQGIGFGSLGAMSFLLNHNLFGNLFRRRRIQKGSRGSPAKKG
jgi:hypothetical protein